MKFLIFTLLLFTQLSFANSQVGFDGFGEIRMGKSYDDLKKELVEVEEAPEYSWFAPYSIDYYIAEFGADSASYYEMQEADRLLEEEMGVHKIWCSFKNKKYNNIGGLTIECAQLVFENDVLRGMMIVFNPKDITAASKRKLQDDLYNVLGETSCTYSVNFEDPPFYCGWYGEDGSEIVVSDMIEEGGGPGLSVNMTFWK